MAVLVAVIALGVYWFWWSDQRANSPVSVEGRISVVGAPMPLKADFTLQAVPGKLRVNFKGGKIGLSAIVRLDKREIVLISDTNKTYVRTEFDLVDKSQTEPPEKWELTWPKELKRTAEWAYIGAGDRKWFCNKQTPTEAIERLELPGGLPPGLKLPGVPERKGASAPAQGEIWFTSETRLGRRYFSMLNKLARIRPVGEKVAESEKRPQWKYVNLDFFPIPMKVVASEGGQRLEMEVTKLSRKKIPKKVFETTIPAGYKKVEMAEFATGLLVQLPRQ